MINIIFKLSYCENNIWRTFLEICFFNYRHTSTYEDLKERYKFTKMCKFLRYIYIKKDLRYYIYRYITKIKIPLLDYLQKYNFYLEIELFLEHFYLCNVTSIRILLLKKKCLEAFFQFDLLINAINIYNNSINLINGFDQYVEFLVVFYVAAKAIFYFQLTFNLILYSL